MKDLVTEKNKEQFMYWWHNETNHYEGLDNIIAGGQPFNAFEHLPFEMQIGVLLAYYDSLGIYIHTTYEEFTDTKGGLPVEIKTWSSWVGDDLIPNLKSRNEAYTEAFIKSDEIVNNNLK